MEFNKRIYKCLYINYLCVKRQKSEDMDSVMENYNKDLTLLTLKKTTKSIKMCRI